MLTNIGFDTAENEPRQVCWLTRAREPGFGIVSVPGRSTESGLAAHLKAFELGARDVQRKKEGLPISVG